jgi:hypothetical protein
MLLRAVDKHAYEKIQPLVTNVLNKGGQLLETATGGKFAAHTVQESFKNVAKHVSSALQGKNPHIKELMTNAANIGMNYAKERITQKLQDKLGASYNPDTEDQDYENNFSDTSKTEIDDKTEIGDNN